MKHDAAQKVIRFIIKYIWIFCAVLIVMEITSTVYSTTILMQQSSQGVLQSVSGEISGRVDGVLRMLTGLSKDNRFADTEAPLFDRAVLARPYKESYNLFMIALTDQEVNVVSTNQTRPPSENTSLAHRDYLQRLYASGMYQITDAFLAGTDEKTMNYTIAVPILKEGKTEGCVFGSIYFNDIEDILERNTYGDSRRFYLTGRDNTFMAGGGKALYGKSFLESSQSSHFFGTNNVEIDQNMRQGNSGNHWQWGKNGLCFITYTRVAPTNWTLSYEVQFSSVFNMLIPALLIKILLYILLCMAISVFGRRYLKRQLAEVSHLFEKMTAMQRALFHSEQGDYSEILDLSAKGLTDQLTGLATRTVLYSKMQPLLSESGSICAVLFLDLDDLKPINDTFGHEAGDAALIHFAKVLKKFEETHHGLAARYGGDEFILILKDMDEYRAAKMANALCIALRTTIQANGKNIPINGSIGVALCPQHGEKAEDLICKADLALYIAKRNGKNRYMVYRDDISSHLLT